MVKEHIFNKIVSNFSFSPTASQISAMKQMAEFITINSKNPLLLIKGYAGTGKTALVGSFVKVLKELSIKVVLLAPTGRAAKVLSAEVGQVAYTIHKKIYRQASSKNGFGSFNLDRNLHKDTIFIVDEASMISNDSAGSFLFGSGYLLDDLIQFVYAAQNCRLLLLGDTAQLPPVGISLSPALEADYLKAYDLEVLELTMTDVVRQQFAGGILQNATSLRQLLDTTYEIRDYPKIKTEGFDDIHRISGAQLMEELNNCYDIFGLEETLVICRTNKRANLYNQGIRNSILFREEELSTGDYILVMKNNYHWVKEEDEIGFIANGDIARIERIKKHYDLYGFHFADVTCRLLDYKDIELDLRVNLDSINSPGAGFSKEEYENFLNIVMEDYQNYKSKRKQYELARENDFYNALQIKFAYAMTCHKAQGGQWKAVFVDLGYFTDEYLSRDLLRWLYTAITRARKKLFLVNFPDKFFNE